METAPSSLLHHRPPAGFRYLPTKLHRPNKLTTTVVSASKRGGHHVDENMIVLRKRIHEMKMAERNYEPPSHWMEWEKQFYTSYDSNVCEVVGALQTLLMNTRPGVAVGIVALVLLSVPTSVALTSYHFLQALSTLLPGIHMG